MPRSSKRSSNASAIPTSRPFSSCVMSSPIRRAFPLGMEAAVYASSLSTIDVDTKEEIEYLRELAHGLRLQPKLCNQIHQQYGVKPIF